MAKEKKPFIIGIPIYEGVDLMDVVAPYEMFNWMGVKWQESKVEERKLEVYLVAEKRDKVCAQFGLQLTPHKTFAEVPKLDLLWVPGGNPDELQKRMRDKTFLDFLKVWSKDAMYVSSVCEGAMLLASAGLLDGYEATTHWMFIPCLKEFPKIKVAAGYPRYVVDRNRVTGGGISSGLDEALKLIWLISGLDIAKEVQLITQYFPEPPVTGDIPDPYDCPIKSLNPSRKAQP